MRLNVGGPAAARCLGAYAGNELPGMIVIWWQE